MNLAKIPSISCFKETLTICYPVGFPGGISGKEHDCQSRRHKRLQFDPWIKKILQRWASQPIPVFSTGEYHEKRNRLPCVGSQRVRHDWSNVAYTGTSCAVRAHSTVYTDCSPPRSSVHGITPARILDWFAISSSYGSWLSKWILYPLSHRGSPICYLMQSLKYSVSLSLNPTYPISLNICHCTHISILKQDLSLHFFCDDLVSK